MAAAPPATPLRFGPNKYAAFYLLFSRWLRHYATPQQYSYVTLGGTELRDVRNLRFVDPKLVTAAASYEHDRGRHALATARVEELRKLGIDVTAIEGDVLSCTRVSEHAHIFFFDVTGVFAWADYHERLAGLFLREVIKEGDVFFITSHLGRNPGWARVFSYFSGEFGLLRATDNDSKRSWYRRAHPSFTIFKALREARVEDQLRIRCFGGVEYRDTSPMGLYGYAVMPGRTNFTEFIDDPDAPYFRLGRD